MKVPLLTEKEAIVWLYQLAQRDQSIATESEQKAARELVDNLGYLPLVITQAAAYLREHLLLLVLTNRASQFGVFKVLQLTCTPFNKQAS